MALALLALVLAAASHVVVAARLGGASLERTSGGRLSADAAAQILASEVRRAGYRPAADSTTPWAGAALVVELRPDVAQGDALEVRYLDDRGAGPPIPRDRRFDVGVDGRGASQLYQAAGGASRQPVVEGVESLRVLGAIDADGYHDLASPAAPAPSRPWAIELEVRAVGGTLRRTVVELPSRPETVLVAP